MCVFAMFAALLVLFKQADKSCCIIHCFYSQSQMFSFSFDAWIVLIERGVL